jgi:hypothetical protein
MNRGHRLRQFGLKRCLMTDHKKLADQDSAWKEMLDKFLPAFLEFFFPQIYPEINWQRS